jgi:hypothetical protein
LIRSLPELHPRSDAVSNAAPERADHELFFNCVYARIDSRRVQLLTRTGLDWTDKYPSVIAAVANVQAKTASLVTRGSGQSSINQRQSGFDGFR